MGDQIDTFLANPWVWALIVASVAVWLVAIVLVFRSPKFVNKVLWAILTIVSFSFHWANQGINLSISIPLGAAYVIWFWRFGPEPSAEKLAKAAATRVGPVDPHKKRLLCIVYAFALAATLCMFWPIVSGEILSLFLGAGGGALPVDRNLLTYMTAIPLALALAVFVFLAARPYWWGKILLLWAGVSWAGFGLVATSLFGGRPQPATILPLAAGLIMLAACIAHQSIDGRWSGGFIRGRGAVAS